MELAVQNPNEALEREREREGLLVGFLERETPAFRVPGIGTVVVVVVVVGIFIYFWSWRFCGALLLLLGWRSS